MAKVKMSLYEALNRKSVMEKQIREINTVYRMVDKKLKSSTTEILDGTALADVDKSISAAYDRSVAVVQNYQNLCAAIYKANSETTITIGGKTMTIAEAIGREKYISVEEKIYTSMINTYNKMKSEVDTSNARNLSPESISTYVEKVLGDSKKDENLIRATENIYKTQHEVEMYDPLNSYEVGTKKLEELNEFKERLHFELTNINCKTEIEVDFVD